MSKEIRERLDGLIKSEESETDFDFESIDHQKEAANMRAIISLHYPRFFSTKVMRSSESVYLRVWKK